MVLPHDPAPSGRVAPVTPWPATLVCARAQMADASHQARRLAYSRRDSRRADFPIRRSPPIRPRSWCAGNRFRWSRACTATDSGAVSAGSNPAGAQLRVLNSNTLTILTCFDVRPVTCGNAQPFPGLAPYTRPESSHQPGKACSAAFSDNGYPGRCPDRRPLLFRVAAATQPQRQQRRGAAVQRAPAL